MGNIYAPNDDNFLKNVLSHLLSFECEDIRDRSFFMREGGLVGFGGGHSKKIGLKGGASRKKMKERGEGGADEKIRLKIG